MRILIIIASTLYFSDIYSQVDEYKMRVELNSHQLIDQPLGEITQRATILDFKKQPTPYIENLFQVIKYQTECYVSQESYNKNKFLYRSKSILGSGFYVDNVWVQSNQSELTNAILSQFDLQNLDRLELLYGSNLVLSNNQNAATLSLYNSHLELLEPVTKVLIKPIVQLGTIDRFAALRTSYRHKSLWSNDFYLSWKGSSKFQTAKKDIYHLRQNTIQIQNTIQKKLNPNNYIKAYVNLGLKNKAEDISLEFDSLNLKNSSISQINPTIFSYIQWKTLSADSKWYSKLVNSISYLHSSIFDSSSFLNGLTQTQNYDIDKISLQSAGFKNLGSRSVYTYGVRLSLENIDITSTPFLTSLSFMSPIIKSNIYFKKEYRTSSDVSWIFGGNIGLTNGNFKTDSSNLDNIKRLMPEGSLQFSWTRHVCENSNYSLNLFLNLIPPQYNDILPDSYRPYFLANEHLSSEKNLSFEGNLYRKFEDIIEWNLSTFYTLADDAIRTRDYYADTNAQILFNGTKNYILQNENLGLSSHFGIQNELKVHVSKSVLTYANIQCNHFLIHNQSLGSKYISKNIPVYGNLGVKVKYRKVFTELWAHFNAGRELTLFNRTRYESAYSNSSDNFKSYYTFHLSSSIHILKRLQVSLRLDNILNANTFNYLSRIPNSGFTGSVQLKLQL